MNKKSAFIGKSYFLMFFLLLLFWIIIAGQLTLETFVIGSMASLAIVFLNRDLFFTSVDGGPVNDKFFFNFFKIIGVLIIEIIKSNIQVAKIVLNPKLPISPSFVKVPVKAKKDFNKVLYGNIITLTPGTLTVDVTDDNEYVIHALTTEISEGLKDSQLEELVLRLEVEK